MMGLSLLPNGLSLNEWLQKLPQSLPLGSTPSTEVHRRNSMRLLKYSPATSKTSHEPIFLIPSMINRHYILDLLPGKSLVEFLTRQGFPVYLLDWGIPCDEDRYLDFSSLIENRVLEFLEVALEMEKTSRVHLMGHCLGGTLACMVASLAPDRIRSLSLLTTPVHFTRGDKLSIWAQHPKFDVDAFVEAYGHAPWSLLQGTFLSLKPTMWIKKTQKFFARWKDPEFQKMFWALEIWSADNISLIGSVYQLMLRDLYRQDALSLGTLRIGTETVSLKNIQSPILNIFAKDDHIVLPEAVLKTSDLSDSQSAYKEFEMQGGHVGAVLNGRSQATLWPEITAWLGQQEAQVN